MTTSPAPISAADREVDPDDLGDALEAAGMSIGVPRPQMLALAARVVELAAALAQSKSLHADAEEWGRGLEARATALLEALTDARDNGLIYWEPQTTRGAMSKMEMLARIDRAAINAGASNDRK